VDVGKKVVLYVVVRLGEVDIKRLMYVMYLIDHEIYYIAGFTLFEWKYVFSGLRSFDVYDVVDSLVDLGYLEKEVGDKDIVYRVRGERRVELPKQLKDVVDKVLVKVEGDVNLGEYVMKVIDPNIVNVAGLGV
jgi:hypothetical protein